jgi:zinc finger protein
MPDKITKQECPVCKEKELELTEQSYNIPHFGKCFLLVMNCQKCKYHTSDIQSEETKPPIKITFEVQKKEDLNVRVIKSANATVKIPQMRMSMESGPASIGFLTNVEGLLRRFKRIIEGQRDNAEDNSIRKKAKNLLKKLWKIELGEEKLKIIIEDKSGNSAILSNKAETKKL